ncbi:uncharacterized protein LOC111695985 isoform X2 [Eurytemora carolleeae]|uniref:uncharacterized protein LOC111695985 isoform X2 n=1 Tax=Eurytemora carolleeae TaxID=1294199 RepID=UPI000C76CB3C|nr:uncharacterized protein LOC111695985 isoform X2 [Eurytemora carolleeae]|eukprot:XP_023321253.1 uncharacterized protein LOC111695985 isoform X2 [Eurytemora affinis]
MFILPLILFLVPALCLVPPQRDFPHSGRNLGRRFNNLTFIEGRVFEVSLPNGKSAGCQGIESYPSDWPNSYYYKRMCYSGLGFPVITDSLANDASLERTAWTLDNIMSTVDPYVTNIMIQAFFRQAVMGRFPSEVVTSLPEYSHLDPNFWYNRRGCGATDGIPVGSNAEEDVLCYSDDLYFDQDITVHEFAHSLHLLGFKHTWPEFQQELDVAYANAYANSLWGWGYIGSYAMTNDEEYFAEGLQAYFDVGYPYDEQGAPWNRALLYQKDPTLAKIIDRFMKQNPWRGSCP